MPHISATEETEHLQECDDCRDEVSGLRRVVQDSADIEKTRRALAEEETSFDSVIRK